MGIIPPGLEALHHHGVQFPSLPPTNFPFLQSPTIIPTHQRSQALRSQSRTNTQNPHPQEHKKHTQPLTMTELETLAQQIHRHIRQYSRSRSEQSSVNPLRRRVIPLSPLGDREPRRRYARADGLTESAEGEGVE